jgi:hypothetical protein
MGASAAEWRSTGGHWRSKDGTYSAVSNDIPDGTEVVVARENGIRITHEYYWRFLPAGRGRLASGQPSPCGRTSGLLLLLAAERFRAWSLASAVSTRYNTPRATPFVRRVSASLNHNVPFGSGEINCCTSISGLSHALHHDF